jgi:cytochrome c oxidase cbb3-type subunit I
MTNASAASKSMTIGEAVLWPLFAVLSFLCVIAAAMAHDAAFAFHASLGAVASLSAAFVILNRYYDRPAELPPQEVNGRPNYNLGPIKFASVAAVFWGIAGFAVGLIIASQLAWPALNFDLP